MTLRLFLLAPASAWTGRVNQASFSYPLGEVTYDAGATTITPENEMTVLFGTSAGDDDLGRSRIRDATGIGATGTLKIGRSSQGIRDGEVKLQDDAYITILNDFRVWAKIPYIDVDDSTSPATTTTYKDHDLTVGTKTGADTPPVCNTGVGFAATIDSGTSVITASWDASTNSFAVADGETISSYLWDVDDGTITVGSTSTAAITATFPAGFRWVKCTVTDSNSQTHSMRMPVYARNPASDTTISAFNIDSHQITPQGQRIAIRITESIAESTYPDGTLVMIWEDEPASASDRSHMVFIGWHHTDPATISAQRTGILQDTVLECLDVAGKLDTLPGFAQSIYGDATPASWEEMVAPNMDKYLHYLLHWHSTALDLADWTNTGTGSAYPFVVLGSDGESLWDQVSRRAKALVPDYVLTCNTLGQMATIVDPMLQDTGDRTATSQTTLGEDDWSAIEYAHQRPPRVHWLRGDAILASSNTIAALFCVAPGSAPGQGEIESTSGEQLAKSQGDLNACEGHRYARLNAPEGLFRVTLAGGSDQDLEPANMTWVTLAISTNTAAQRGQVISHRFLMQEINILYEHTRTGLVRTVELLLEREVSGVPAETYIQPEDDIPDPEYDPPPPPTYDDDPGENYGDGFGTLYALYTDVLGRTRDFGATSPSYTDITPAIVGSIHDFILDPWAPTTKGYLAEDDTIWKSTNLDQVSPTFSKVLELDVVADSLVPGATGTQAYKVVGSINQQDYVGCAWRHSTLGYYFSYSENGGSSWNHSFIVSGLQSYYRGGLDIVPHTINGSLRLYFIGQTGGAQLVMYRSDNKGATWSLVSAAAQGLPDPDFITCLGLSVQCPYEDNADGDVVYMAWDRVQNPPGYMYRTLDAGATCTRLGLTNDRTYAKRHGLEADIQDRNRVFAWRYDGTLWLSTNGGVTFAQKSATGLSGNIYAGGGFPTNNSRFYALTSTGIFVSIDGGTTFIDKTGDWAFGFSVVVGSGTIIPVWVAE